MRKLRCAIYTRKSSEEGLEQDFNSLDAQREACAAFIESQKAEGWILLPERYDDGGLSGGTLERPALERLLSAIDEGKVDQILVYKIDRLTRSLADFAKIVERLDATGASFVSVTQSFNTATSMGRLTLNMLLSFAQFEREVTAERIRDKIAASKKKGLWMGASVPIGYDADGRTLSINQKEAEIVRTIFRLYRDLGTIRAVKERCDALGFRTRVRQLSTGQQVGGTQFFTGHIQYILTNPVYAGRIRHRGNVYDGMHPPLIEPDEWDETQKRLQVAARKSRRPGGRGSSAGKATVSRLAGKVFDETGDRLTPTHSKTKQGTRIRYYVSNRLIRHGGAKDVSAWRLPGPDLEILVEHLVHQHLEAPEFPVRAVPALAADAVATLRARIERVTAGGFSSEPQSASPLLDLVQRVDIDRGEIRILLSSANVAEMLGQPEDAVESDALVIASSFTHRKRGVETKLILAGEARPRDDTLFRNIAKAHRYMAAIRSGKTFSEIAKSEGASKRRIQHLIEFAFLAPDVVRRVHEGQQPVGLTSEWLKQNDIPADWRAQRELFATL